MRKFLIIGLALCCTGLNAQTYRWTDGSGRTVISDTPPPGQARNVAQAGGKAQPDEGLSFATKKAVESFPVLLYTAPECVEECRQARELLQKRKVPFAERSIQTPEEFDELKKLVGDVFVPTLKVGNQRQRGYSPDAYHNLLDIAGYPKTSGGKP